MTKPARLLSIAGSDSGGGAGIQADIKTASALGVYAMTAITAVTAQDTTGIGAVHPIPPAVVRAQIARCLADIGADAIKIGMLGAAAIAREVAAALPRGIPLVVDPILASSSGTALADGGVIEVLKADLFPRATLITPNLPETEALCGFALADPEDVLRAGEMLLSLGPDAVLIKGGHGSEATITDVLFTLDTPPRLFFAPRIETRHTHGTGCTLATAIACGLAQGLPLTDAIARAHAFVQNAIATAPGFGHGSGPLNHLK